MDNELSNGKGNNRLTMGNFSSFTDGQLAEAIKRSDSQAFKALYYRYYEKIFQFIWLRTRSTELSKDLTQEVFSKTWNKRGNLDPNQSIKAYLYRISNNLVINHFQHQKVEKKYLANLDAESFITNPDENFELRDKITREIENLPEKQRTVFTMHRFENFSYAEIAKTLDISIKTVEKRMSQALRILRLRLAKFVDK